ncbi:MAG: type II toxin-antitoxin system RelE/ParE family toxin [Pseudomonadota bacterium]
MTRAKLTAAAKRDVVQIRQFTVDRWGREQWLRYFAGLSEAFEQIAADLACGRPRDMLRTGLRSLTYETHLIFFRPVRHAGGAVVILRILHQRQNLAALKFFQEFEG